MRFRSSRGIAVALGAAGAWLLATFLDPGLAGVHRWVQAGPLRVHAGAICLPVSLVALGATLRAPLPVGRREWFVPLTGVGILGILVLQPDRGQAFAFGSALLALLYCGPVRTPVTAVTARFIAMGVCLAWIPRDGLPPVPHVEGIVGMAAHDGALWRAGALLALLPLPFLFVGRSADAPTAWALGIYFLACLAAPLFGAFPVPVMGFGLSPVIGYFLALGWLVARGRRRED